MANSSRARWSGLIWLVLLALGVPPGIGRGAEPAEDAAAGRRQEVLNLFRQNAFLPPARVKELLGDPAHVSRQIVHRRYLEQWSYDAPVALCVEFDYQRGREPRVVNVQVLGKAKP